MDNLAAIRDSERSGGPTGRRRVLSMSDQVTASLREMILTGEMLPGQQITHEQIAEALDVSTMPVREALLRLTHEGLIEGGAKSRSYRVSVTTRTDVEDIYWMHAMLSGKITARAALRLTDEQVDGLAKAHKDWVAAAKTGNEIALSVANDAFHRIINLGADAPKLIQFLRQTLNLIPDRYYSMIPDQISKSTKAHGEILKAIERRDAEAARVAAERHVLESGKELIKNFDDKGFWTVPV